MSIHLWQKSNQVKLLLSLPNIILPYRWYCSLGTFTGGVHVVVDYQPLDVLTNLLQCYVFASIAPPHTHTH